MTAAVRMAERTAGPSAIPFVLLPWIAADLMRRARDYRQFCRLRSSLPAGFWKGTSPFRHYVRMISHWQRTMAMCVLADRISRARWRGRLRVHGTPPDEVTEWGERPVIMACLHTGGYAFLRHWLRSRGIIVASLVKARPRIIRRYEEERQRRQCEKGELPNFIHVNNMRAAVRFLAPGRILIVAIEAQPDSRADTIMVGAPFRMGGGAARLARLTGATLLPASVWLNRSLDIRFGRPVPREIVERENPHAANEFLARELWSDLAQDRCAVGWTTLEAYAPAHLVRPRTRWP